MQQTTLCVRMNLYGLCGCKKYRDYGAQGGATENAERRPGNASGPPPSAGRSGLSGRGLGVQWVLSGVLFTGSPGHQLFSLPANLPTSTDGTAGRKILCVFPASSVLRAGT